MSKNQLMPTKDVSAFIDKETGEVSVKYRPGHPRSYRFDASRGVFNIRGGDNITKKAEALSFIPIGYRIFRDDILGFGVKNWVEFFFLNNDGHVCDLLFHGYSVEELERCTNDLFYDDVNLSQVVITATPFERTKKSEGNGKGNKYFIASFSYKVLSDEQKEDVRTIGDGLQLYRHDTLTGDCQIDLAVNYSPPIRFINGGGNVVDEDGKDKASANTAAA
ncbi:MAG: hypothetical protein AAF731_07735 [Bacteroidota bacterium]